MIDVSRSARKVTRKIESITRVNGRPVVHSRSLVCWSSSSKPIAVSRLTEPGGVSCVGELADTAKLLSSKYMLRLEFLFIGRRKMQNLAQS